MTVRMPTQLFINGEFVDSSNGRTFDAINPTDGSVRGQIFCLASVIQVYCTRKNYQAVTSVF